jgi:hypothetical protein
MKKKLLIVSVFVFILSSCTTNQPLAQAKTEQEKYLLDFVKPYNNDDGSVSWRQTYRYKDSHWAEFVWNIYTYGNAFGEDKVNFNDYSLEELYYFKFLLDDYQHELVNPIAHCLGVDLMEYSWMPKACPYFDYYPVEDLDSPGYYNSIFIGFDTYGYSSKWTLDFYLEHSQWVCQNLSNDSFNAQAFVNRLFFDSFTSSDSLNKDTSNLQWLLAKSAIKHMCPENKIKFYSTISVLPQN